jgi:hypothetical protein
MATSCLPPLSYTHALRRPALELGAKIKLRFDGALILHETVPAIRRFHDAVCAADACAHFQNLSTSHRNRSTHDMSEARISGLYTDSMITVM